MASPAMTSVNIWTVLLAAGLTALATGLGVIPFLFVRDINRWLLSISNAVAAGLMLAATHSLVSEGSASSPARTLAGVLVGVCLIVLANRLIRRRGGFDIADLAGGNARKALLILGVMTAHSFAEGVGVGVSFGGGKELGVFITAAIAVHNVPEGLAISLVLVPRGTQLWKAAGWSVFTSLPQPLMALPAFVLVFVFEPFLPFGLGLAGGAMIWMVFAELIPDALEHASSAAAATTVTLAFAAMLAFQRLLVP